MSDKQLQKIKIKPSMDLGININEARERINNLLEQFKDNGAQFIAGKFLLLEQDSIIALLLKHLNLKVIGNHDDLLKIIDLYINDFESILESEEQRMETFPGHNYKFADYYSEIKKAKEIVKQSELNEGEIGLLVFENKVLFAISDGDQIKYTFFKPNSGCARNAISFLQENRSNIEIPFYKFNAISSKEAHNMITNGDNTPRMISFEDVIQNTKSHLNEDITDENSIKTLAAFYFLAYSSYLKGAFSDNFSSFDFSSDINLQ